MSPAPGAQPATLSVIIAAKNCADRIEGTVRPWLFAFEVIVVDQRSTDGTAEKAAALGARVIRRDPPGGNFDLNRKHGLEQARGEWLLYIDTDERPTPELLEELRAFLTAPPALVSGVKIPNEFYFLGGALRHGIFNARSAEVRLFKQGAWHYPCEDGYHRGVSVTEGQVARFKHPYKHFNVNGLSEWFLKTNQYTELDASPAKTRTWGALLDFTRFFLRHYFWKRGFLDGWRGFLACWYFGMYHFTLSAKSWERAQLEHAQLERDYLAPLAPQGR